MIKRIWSVILVFSMCVVLSACRGSMSNSDNDKISIVCTTFAAYDWTRTLVGENSDDFSVVLLGDGADLHSFQPTAEDIVKIHTADLFVQIGGTTEAWTEELNIEHQKVLRFFDLLDDAEKLCIAGQHNNITLSEQNCDEHIWLSLKLAGRMAEAICDKICDLDKVNGVKYQKNCAEYLEILKALDLQYKSAADSSADKTVIFADRYPFAYLMKDYGITCFSAFDGCSSDTDASFDTIVHLAEEVKTYNKDTVLILENSAESVAEPLKAALDGRNVDTAVMNSCQSIDVDTLQNSSYIGIMTKNLESLKKALRGQNAYAN